MEQGHESGGDRSANVLLTGGTTISRDGGALRDPRSTVPMCVGGCPLLCGAVCVCGLRSSVLRCGLWSLVVRLPNASCP